MNPRPLVVGIALLAVVLPSLVQAEPPNPAGPDCPDEAFVPGQGPSCRAGGIWRVRLGDGTWIETHGPDSDAILQDVPPLEALADLPPNAVPQCSTGAAGNYLGLLVYARPANKPDRYDQMAPFIRAHFLAANAILAAEAAQFGVVARYRVGCGDGLSNSQVPHVVNAVLATPSGSDSFSTIVTNLKSLGYGSTFVKYWVWYDDGVPCGCSGQGSLNIDDRLLLSNANNVGPDYGITYGVLTEAYFVMMHENGHNLGAVQLSAPNTSGGFHCNDGQDIMCYDDGGPTSNYNAQVCLIVDRFDCNHNDYFHPAPPFGNYLRTHWNLGSTLNRFVKFGA